MTKNQKMDAFWETKEGKRIRSYGGWLIGTGIIQIVLALLALIITDITFSLYYVFLAARAVFFINRGILIRMNKLKPEQLSMVCLVTIATVIIEAIFIYVLRDYSYSGQSSSFLPFLDIVVLIDSIRCLVEWRKPYIKLYESDKKSEKHSYKTDQKEWNDTNKPTTKANDDKYEDDMI